MVCSEFQWSSLMQRLKVVNIVNKFHKLTAENINCWKRCLLEHKSSGQLTWCMCGLIVSSANHNEPPRFWTKLHFEASTKPWCHYDPKHVLSLFYYTRSVSITLLIKYGGLFQKHSQTSWWLKRKVL